MAQVHRVGASAGAALRQVASTLLQRYSAVHGATFDPSMKRGGRTIAKGNLPSKTCRTCGRPFTWRKKWERIWDEVQYCSERCRRTRRARGLT